jgi:hypothetical protein
MSLASVVTPLKLTAPLSRKSVLCSVVVKQWTARKLDRAVTDETNKRHNATKDAGRYNKLLIAAEHLSELNNLAGEARRMHYKMTQPWTDEGPRILANMLYSKFCDEFRVFKRKFNDAADRFARAYPRYVEERKEALNGLFNEADYPSAADIRSKFSLDYDIMPFPDADDFRSDLDDDTVAEIKAKLKETTSNVVDNAMKHTAEQIVAVVGKMAKKLGEYRPSAGKGDKSEGIFRDSLVENVRELGALLPAFNLTQDPRFDAVTARIQRELCIEDAADLRENDQARAAVQKSADEIVAAVSSMFG